jgi:hypothetical protein
MTRYSHERVNRSKIRERSRNNTYIYCWKVLWLTRVYKCESELLEKGERDKINARFESSKSIEYTIEKNYDR